MRMVRINSTLPDRLISLLDAEADGLGISRSELLRRILDGHFENKPRAKTKKRGTS